MGAIGLGFWVVAALAYVIFWSYQFEYILFLSVYLIDTGYTFIQRLLNGENVFQAHRKHLYQVLVNEKGMSHLVVAGIYSGIQLGVNAFVTLTSFPLIPTVIYVAVPLSGAYILIKRKIIHDNLREAAQNQ